METRTKRIFGFFGLFMLVAGCTFIMPVTQDGETGELAFNFSSATATATTKMVSVQCEDSLGNNLLSPAYTATGQNRIVDSGDDLSVIAITYLLDKSYASTAQEAKDNSRFHVTLTDPSAVVQWNGYIYAGGGGVNLSQVSDSGDSWACYLEVELVDGPYTLTTGTWDLDIRYEIYI